MLKRDDFSLFALLNLPLHEPSFIECDADIQHEIIFSNQTLVTGSESDPLESDVHQRTTDFGYRQTDTGRQTELSGTFCSIDLILRSRI